MFHITLTEITSFDFDYIGAAVLILGHHLLTLLSQMQYLFEGSTPSRVAIFGINMVWC